MKLDDRALEAMVTSSPANERAHIVFADRYVGRGDFGNALALLDKFLASQPQQTSFESVYFKAKILESIGKDADAMPCFQSVLGILGSDRSSPEKLCAAGVSHYRLHSLLPAATAQPHAELALRDLEELTRLYPDYDDDIEMVTFAIGDLRAEKGDFAGAINAYRRSVELCTDAEPRLWTLLHLAATYRSAGDFEAAERVCATALATAPEPMRAVLHLELGRILLKRRRVQDARAAFESALTLENASHIPEYAQYVADLLWQLAALAYVRADSAAALAYLERALPLSPSNHPCFVDINIVLGHCYAERGEQGRATKHYNEVMFAPLATPEQIEMAERCLREMGGGGQHRHLI